MAVTGVYRALPNQRIFQLGNKTTAQASQTDALLYPQGGPLVKQAKQKKLARMSSRWNPHTWLVGMQNSRASMETLGPAS